MRQQEGQARARVKRGDEEAYTVLLPREAEVLPLDALLEALALLNRCVQGALAPGARGTKPSCKLRSCICDLLRSSTPAGPHFGPGADPLRLCTCCPPRTRSTPARHAAVLALAAPEARSAAEYNSAAARPISQALTSLSSPASHTGLVSKDSSASRENSGATLSA